MSAADRVLHCLSLIRRAEAISCSVRLLREKKKAVAEAKALEFTHPSLQLEFVLELQLDSPWEEQVAATAGSRIGKEVNDAESTSVVRREISRPVPNMSIKSIQEVHLKQ